MNNIVYFKPPGANGNLASKVYVEMVDTDKARITIELFADYDLNVCVSHASTTVQGYHLMDMVRLMAANMGYDLTRKADK